MKGARLYIHIYRLYMHTDGRTLINTNRAGVVVEAFLPGPEGEEARYVGPPVWIVKVVFGGMALAP